MNGLSRNNLVLKDMLNRSSRNRDMEKSSGTYLENPGSPNSYLHTALGEMLRMNPLQNGPSHSF